MQTLSPTISPNITPTIAKKVADADILPAIAQSSVLQTALAGLDASLNDELDRYRHWQANGQTISYLNPFRPRAISTQSIWTSPSLSTALSPNAPEIEAPITHSDRHSIQMPVMPSISANISPANISSANISSAELHQYRGLDTLDQLETIAEHLPNGENHHGENHGENHRHEDNSPYTQNVHSYGDAPKMAQNSMLDDDEILQSFANDYANSYQDTENQHNQVPIPSAPPERSALRSLMNPVGIISLLLLLCSSAAIGYLLVDPSGVMKLFKSEPRPKAAQTDGKNEDSGRDINLQNQQKNNDSSLSFVPFAGDKAKIQLETTNKANKPFTSSAIASKNLLTNPSSKPSNLFVPSSNTFVPSVPLRTVPSSNFPPISVAPLPSALAPVESSYTPPARSSYEVAPAPAYSEPAPRTATRSTYAPRTPAYVAPAASTYVAPRTPAYVAPPNNTSVKYAAPLSAAPAASAPAASYRVVVENSYAASAQQVERDAYVRPSDGQVQVGSYRDSNVAQQRIEQLRRQGIPARIE